ncbi:heavy-metal-associated domain-containing protein [Dongia soli]|uniref:Heavy-metal-associated domain-containing protein n=1 Tax=Dongia soli TaxID=600628 RepID=A0ABU5E885_9PROT|nr:heavy-metal-associated domain-containing protein [Dongia soli]MDY0882127.1 heavy-metal-associated domain-containing protein [Dongia soli]
MLKLAVSGMTCGGCAAAIQRSLNAAVPGAKIEVDLAKGTVAVDASQSQAETVKSAIEDAGFTVTGAAN